MNLRSIAIAPRAALGFGLIALLVFIPGGFALAQMSRMHEHSSAIEDNWIPRFNALNDVSQDLLRLRSMTLRLLLSEDASQPRDNAALQQIIQSIADIGGRNLVIASATEEQAHVASEADRNLINIRDLSLQSAASSEQTGRASRALADLPVDLRVMVTRFRV